MPFSAIWVYLAYAKLNLTLTFKMLTFVMFPKGFTTIALYLQALAKPFFWKRLLIHLKDISSIVASKYKSCRFFATNFGFRELNHIQLKMKMLKFLNAYHLKMTFFSFIGTGSQKEIHPLIT